MIEIPRNLLDQIGEHGAAAYPFECGGMLIGRIDGQKRVVSRIMPMENAVADQFDRVLIDPKDVMRAERFARQNGLDVIGFYHSHPEDRSIPSQFDLDHALPVWSYVIVSVLGGAAADTRSWIMRDDRSQFDEEQIISGLSASPV